MRNAAEKRMRRDWIFLIRENSAENSCLDGTDKVCLCITSALFFVMDTLSKVYNHIVCQLLYQKTGWVFYIFGPIRVEGCQLQHLFVDFSRTVYCVRVFLFFGVFFRSCWESGGIINTLLGCDVRDNKQIRCWRQIMAIWIARDFCDFDLVI